MFKFLKRLFYIEDLYNKMRYFDNALFQLEIDISDYVLKLEDRVKELELKNKEKE